MHLRYLTIAGGATFAMFLATAFGAPGDPPGAKAVELPLTRVVLFNAGVGYFQRDGAIDGNARIEMRFPEQDVNDLLKSLILEDKTGGKLKAVTYDGKHPIDVTLKTFAVDLTENPGIAQLLVQVRGEKVEVTDKQGTITVGLIVGVEKPTPVVVNVPTSADVGEQLKPVIIQPVPTGDGELLNLLAVDGLQSVPLSKLRKIKLLKPELEAEFRKALEVLASARGASKKTVVVAFDGKGRRNVKLAYVTEAPMWKATYRLTLGDKDKAQAALQGWATVENTTDEDWTNVKVGLVAGRPMAFEMNLYDPLFVPRPMVEPELFASLRPPVYQGAIDEMQRNPRGGSFGGGFGGGGFGGAANLGAGGGVTGVGGGQLGQFGNLGAQYGMQGGNYYRPSTREQLGPRLSYQDLAARVNEGGGKPNAEATASAGPKVLSAAAAMSLGDHFEYVIEDPVTLPRLKSALLPIVTDSLDCKRVSIFNESDEIKHPLLGLRLTNKTKRNLAQGPMTVYDNDTFAGDARVPDTAPGETRLVSYAIDLNTEVVPRVTRANPVIELAKIVGGLLTVNEKVRITTRYLIRNRGPSERTVIVEHAIRAGWKLFAPEKPMETSRDMYRFEVLAKSSETVTIEVIEDSPTSTNTNLTSISEDALRFYVAAAETGPAIKQALAKVLQMRTSMATAKKSLAEEIAALKAIGDDQTRIRANLERVPKDSEAYKRYLKKFDDQETEIEKRQAKQKELETQIIAEESAYKSYLEKLKVE